MELGVQAKRRHTGFIASMQIEAFEAEKHSFPL